MFDTEDTKITVSATAFKTNCLELLKRLDTGTLEQVTVTKRGKPVAIMTAVPPPIIKDSAWGFLRGMIKIAPGVDLTEPLDIPEPDDPFIGKQDRDDAAA